MQIESAHMDQQSLADVGVAPDEDPTQPSRGIPAESVGVPDPAVGARADGARDASGMKSASFSRAGVASGEAGAASGEAIDFRHQSRGDGLEAFVEETEASVLGAGIVDGRGIRPVEGTETVGISHRKVHLSAGYGPLGRQLVYDWFNRPVLEPIQSNCQRFKGNWLRPYENAGLETLINMFHE